MQAEAGGGATLPDAASVLRTKAKFSCDMPLDDVEGEDADGEYVYVQAGRTVAEALGEILKALGCKVGEVTDAGDHGWDLSFEYRSASLSFELTAIDGVWLQFHGPEASWPVFGKPKPANPDYVEILLRLSEAIDADGRFSDLGWFDRHEFGNEEVGAPTPLGLYDDAPCVREWPVDPMARSAEPRRSDVGVHAPEVAIAQPGWVVAPPRAYRRLVARAFDFWVVAGGLYLGVIAIFIPIGSWDERSRFADVYAIFAVMFPARVATSIALNAAFLHWTSSTPGKWLCGVKVVSKDGRSPTFEVAWGREWAAAWGCAFYIPVVTLYFMARSYSSLSGGGAATWDKERRLVIPQRASSIAQRTAIAFAALAVLLQFALLDGYFTRS